MHPEATAGEGGHRHQLPPPRPSRLPAARGGSRIAPLLVDEAMRGIAQFTFEDK
ncbi:MAG: hypothetical protein ACRECP_00500 [Methylocella sp.]